MLTVVATLQQRCGNVLITLESDAVRKRRWHNSHFRPCHSVVTTSTATLWQRCHNVAVPAGKVVFVFWEAVVQRCSAKKVRKKETQAQVFSCEFCEISKNTFFIEHLLWLLLYFILQNLKDTEDRLEQFFLKLWMKTISTILIQLQDFRRVKHRGGIRNCFCFFPFFKK